MGFRNLTTGDTPMNCEINCHREYASPQGDKKCILLQDDKPSILLELRDGTPQKHWLCEKSPKSMKLSTVDSKPDIKQYILNKKKEVK
jgi:hypothetical protein